MASGKEVIVVGGGISGLRAAGVLKSLGYQVRLFEASDRVGGWIRTRRIDGFLCEYAAGGALPAPNGVLDVCHELGVAVEEANDSLKNRWLIDGEQMVLVPRTPQGLLRSKLLSRRAKLRLMMEPVARKSKGEDESVYAFLARRFGSELAERVSTPLVTGIFAGDPRQLSFRTCFPTLSRMDDQGGVFRSLMQKKGTRSTKRLVTAAGGMESLVGGLAKQISGETATGCTVEKVAGGEHPQVTLANGDVHEADAVVLAVSSSRVAMLLREQRDVDSKRLDGIPHASLAVLHLGFEGKAIEHALNGFGCLNQHPESAPLLGCIFESSVWPGRAPQGHVLLRCLLGGVFHPEVVSWSEERLVAEALEFLRPHLKIIGQPMFSNIVRVHKAIPQYPVGFIGVRDPLVQQLSNNGIYLTGSGFFGVSVNQCLASGHETAMRIDRAFRS